MNYEDIGGTVAPDGTHVKLTVVDGHCFLELDGKEYASVNLNLDNVRILRNKFAIIKRRLQEVH